MEMRMEFIDWLSKNYNWLFSGIGVVILVSLSKIIRIIITRRKAKPNHADSNSDNKSLEISPSDISKKQKHLSDIDFQNYFKSFDGHIVTWDGEIGTVSLDNRDPEKVKIQIIFSGGIMRAFFTIRIKEFPNVKLFKSGDTAKVTGKIAVPNWPTMDLLDVNILEWKKRII